LTLPRGFKTTAESEAKRLRSELGLKIAEPLDIGLLAAHLEVKLFSADDLVDISRLEELERLQSFSFSAATFDIAGQACIVTNPLRTEGRLASDVAHELAHILLEHDLTEVREIEGIPFRTCRPDQEEEATAFGGTLLLPRQLLVNAAYGGLKPEEIATKYKVTVDMARYRFNTTGVGKQVKRATAAK
jgi:hypothetical protein